MYKTMSIRHSHIINTTVTNTDIFSLKRDASFSVKLVMFTIFFSCLSPHLNNQPQIYILDSILNMVQFYLSRMSTDCVLSICNISTT